MPRFALLFFLLLTTVGTAAAQEARTLAATSPVPSSVAGQVEANPTAPTVYHMAEVMPAFPGGNEAFGKFLRDKMKYPDEALRRGTSGKVIVQFVVDERGHILDPKVVKGLGFGLDEEALRLVRIMPWWTPGTVAGQPVRVAYTLPIVFRALE